MKWDIEPNMTHVLIQIHMLIFFRLNLMLLVFLLLHAVLLVLFSIVWNKLHIMLFSVKLCCWSTVNKPNAYGFPI